MVTDPESVTEKIDEVLDAWQHNRALFPGWWITPYRNREVLWERTGRWLGAMLGALPARSLPDQLRCLGEINWRLERLLIPLDGDLASRMDTLLQAIDPFPHALQLPDPQLQRQTADALDWVSLATHWLDLALAVLRHARETQNEDLYSEYRNRLGNLVPERSDIAPRRHYEECLRALYNLDHARASEELREWSDSGADPFWRIWRAAVAAELGDTVAARRDAHEGLREIRQQLYGSPRQVGLLSREGWAILLVQSLDFQQSLSHPLRNHSLRSRLERLGNYRCDPRVELRHFQQSLERPLFSPVPPEVEQPGFDPGTLTVTTRWGTNEGTDHVFASQFVRLAEETARLHWIPEVRMELKTWLHAARRLEHREPRRAIAILLRLADEQAVTQFFSRSRVAGLLPEEFHHLDETIASAAAEAMTAVRSSDDRNRMETAVRRAAVPATYSTFTRSVYFAGIQPVRESDGNGRHQNGCRIGCR